jgi:hypothetical protein
VVLTPRRWCQVSRRYPRGDGDNKARSPRRARRKPLKPLRAGMPGDPGATVVTNARAFYTTRAAAGATGTRHSPRPLGRRNPAQLGRLVPRERGSMSCCHCERGEAIQQTATHSRLLRRYAPRTSPRTCGFRYSALLTSLMRGSAACIRLRYAAR